MGSGTTTGLRSGGAGNQIHGRYDREPGEIDMSDEGIIEANKALVRRYLQEVLDNGNLDLLDELFSADCIIHRPEFPDPIVGLEGFKAFLALGLTRIFCEMKTTLLDIVADAEFVACRLSHRARFFDDVQYPTPVGTIQARGKTVEWAAMAMCRLEDGKAKEEWVRKDETAILEQLGFYSQLREASRQ
jgi:predicted ester cyclase